MAAKPNSSGAKKSAPKCKHCRNKAKSRGCCDSCRIAIFARINRGEFTEQQAIDDGWIDKAKNRGPKPSNGFAVKYQAMKRK